MEPSQIITLMTNVGVPSGLLIIVAVWVSRKIIEPMLRAHLEIVEALKATTASNSSTLNKQSDLLSELTRSYQNNSDQLKELIILEREGNKQIGETLTVTLRQQEVLAKMQTRLFDPPPKRSER